MKCIKSVQVMFPDNSWALYIGAKKDEHKFAHSWACIILRISICANLNWIDLNMSQ